MALRGGQDGSRPLWGSRKSAVGLTLVSLATTAELHALVVTADRRGIEELALAGVLGSALYIATTTLGHAAVMHPLGSVNVTWRAFFAAVLSLLLIFYVLVQGGVAQFVVGYGACLAGTLR